VPGPFPVSLPHFHCHCALKGHLFASQVLRGVAARTTAAVEGMHTRPTAAALTFACLNIGCVDANPICSSERSVGALAHFIRTVTHGCWCLADGDVTVGDRDATGSTDFFDTARCQPSYCRGATPNTTGRSPSIEPEGDMGHMRRVLADWARRTRSTCSELFVVLSSGLSRGSISQTSVMKVV